MKKSSVSEGTTSKRKVIGAIAIVLAVILVLSCALIAVNIWERGQGEVPLPVASAETVTYNGREYTKKKNIDTLLVMGLDKFEAASSSDESYNNDKQADFLMLFVVDNENKACTAIHINRDTMTDINVLGLAGEKVGTVHKQLALAHTYGNGREVSCRNTVTAVSDILMGTRIENYISVTMDTVPEINDLVGGVQVQVLDDFTGIDDTLQKGEIVTLTGEHALTYVRSRYGMEDSTNKARMERQRQYINALVDKTRYCVDNDEDFIFNALETLSENMVSNCTVTELESLFNKLSSYEFSEILSFDGEYVEGDKHIEFYPDVNSIEETVMGLFYEPVN